MKKILLFFISILLISGCSSKTFYLDDSLYGNGEVIQINKDDFEELEKNKNSFAIFIYMPGCTSCNNFDKVLEEYIDKYDIKFYSIEITETKDTSISEKVRYSPSVVIYNKGKMVAYLDAISDDDLKYYESVDGFNTWFTKYVNIKNK